MFESKYGKFITIFLIILVILIIGGLIYLGFNVFKTFNEESDGRDKADEFENQFMQNTQIGDSEDDDNTQTDITNTESNNQGGDVTPDIAPGNDIFNGSSSSSGSSNSSTNTTQTYKGFKVVGTINIPKINFKSVVLEEASSEAIEVAVGVYAGPGLNKVGNTVIAGHNYRNGTFFSNNKKLSNGDKIYIIDSTGNKVTYTIYKIYITSPQDSEYIMRNTNGKREISLTTCTDDTNSRLIIWAVAE